MYEQLQQSLKSVDAEEDKHFQLHLLETKYLKRLSSDSSDIVYGKKGCGKTALRRALTELKSESYFSTITIALEKTSFESVYQHIAGLNSTVKIEKHNIAKAAWKNIFLNYALLSIIDKLDSSDHLQQNLDLILRDEKFIDNDNQTESERNNFRLMNVLESFFYKIVKLPMPDDSPSPLIGVTAEQQNVINHFPFNTKIAALLDDVVQHVSKSEKKILVCIDGFDTIVKHTADSRESIFAGLIDAVYFYNSDKKLSNIICVKAFLPYELTLEAHRITWDADKYLHNVHYISWEENDFKLFIEKRLAPFSKKKSVKFSDVWNEFLPEKITNTVHGIEEISFEYILRHSMYRPRQILIHVYKIIESWNEINSHGGKIQPSFIPSVVAKSNLIMADLIAKNLLIIYPNIIAFLKSWQGSQTTIEASKVKERIVRYLLADKENTEFGEMDVIFDQLFNFGIFGIKSKKASQTTTKRIEFHFAFVGDSSDLTISNIVEEDDLIALSPMFREYCGCQAYAEGIIVPIGLDLLN